MTMSKIWNPDVELCDALATRKDGVTEMIQIPMPDTMKAKDIIRGYFSGDFNDEFSDAYGAFSAVEELLHWQRKQRKAIVASIEPDLMDLCDALTELEKHPDRPETGMLNAFNLLLKRTGLRDA